MISNEDFLSSLGLLVSHLKPTQTLVPAAAGNTEIEMGDGLKWGACACVHVHMHKCAHSCIGKSLMIFYLNINKCQPEILTEFF